MDEKGEENIVAALEHRDRISDLHVFVGAGISLGRRVVAMQEPLPALTNLYVGTFHDGSPVGPVLPDGFLGGYAPCLRKFILQRVAFPAFPKFVLHATQIVFLSLADVPNSWYTSIPPGAMASCLAALPDLETLFISFQSPPSIPLQTTLPTRIHSVLPALTSFRFKGVSEYLEGVIAGIDTPHLNELRIVFFMNLIFDVPQLHRFIGRTERLRPLNPARLQFFGNMIRIILGSSPPRFDLKMKYEEPDRQLSSVTQVCNEDSPLLSQVEGLGIFGTPSIELAGKSEVNSSQWLELFRPFSAVRSLYVSERLEPLVAAALRGLTGERAMEVLPTLRYLSLDELRLPGSVWDAMVPFVAARQLLGHPIVVLRRQNPSPITQV